MRKMLALLITSIILLMQFSAASFAQGTAAEPPGAHNRDGKITTVVSDTYITPGAPGTDIKTPGSQAPNDKDSTVTDNTYGTPGGPDTDKPPGPHALNSKDAAAGNAYGTSGDPDTYIESRETYNLEGNKFTVVRDTYGVPHIYAETDTELFWGSGYVVAQDRLWQAEMNRLVSSGRMSELFGPGELQADQVIRRDGYTDGELINQFNNLPDYAQKGITAYMDGINYYIASTDLSKMPVEFQALGQKPRLWELKDLLRVGQLMIRRFGESGGSELDFASFYNSLIEKYGPEGDKVFNTLFWRGNPGAPATIPEGQDGYQSRSPRKPQNMASFPKADILSGQLKKEQQMKLDIQNKYGFPHKGGSNAWVVAPNKSQNGDTLLLGGPQMGYTVPQIAHEIGIHGAGYNTVGMAFAGAGPIPLIGRGKDYAWTTTTQIADQVDTYMLEINPQNPDQYKYNGKYIDFEKRTEKIGVRGVGVVDFEVYRSVHGPVIYRDSNIAYAQRRSHWGQEISTLVGFWDFNRARNIKQFEKTVYRIATSHNFLYADKQGNIGYWESGRTPVRPAGIDGRFPAAGDGSQEWVAIKQGSQLARSINPPQGYLANWNNRPCYGWDESEGSLGEIHRVQFIMDQLAAENKIGFEDMEQINRQAATVNLYAYYFKDLLIEKLSGSSALPGDIQKAVDKMKAWDCFELDENKDGYYDDPAITILNSWLKNLFNDVFAEIGGQGASYELLYAIIRGPDASLQPEYDFLHGRDINEVVLNALQKTISDLPNLDSLTGIKQIKFSPIGAGKVDPIIYMNRGTYNQIVELDKNKVTSVNILPPGESGVYGSKHFDDQRLLYANWQYKPMLLDIKAFK